VRVRRRLRRKVRPSDDALSEDSGWGFGGRCGLHSFTFIDGEGGVGFTELSDALSGRRLVGFEMVIMAGYEERNMGRGEYGGRPGYFTHAGRSYLHISGGLGWEI
jgi:hypothetical protein